MNRPSEVEFLIKRYNELAYGVGTNEATLIMYILELEELHGRGDEGEFNAECFICKKQTRDGAGNPSLWSIELEYPGGNGRRRIYHRGCVIEVIAKHPPAPPAIEKGDEG